MIYLKGCGGVSEALEINGLGETRFDLDITVTPASSLRAHESLLNYNELALAVCFPEYKLISAIIQK